MFDGFVEKRASQIIEILKNCENTQRESEREGEKE